MPVQIWSKYLEAKIERRENRRIHVLCGQLASRKIYNLYWNEGSSLLGRNQHYFCSISTEKQTSAIGQIIFCSFEFITFKGALQRNVWFGNHVLFILYLQPSSSAVPDECYLLNQYFFKLNE